MRKEKISDHTSVNFLHTYFETSKPPPSMMPPDLDSILTNMNKSRPQSKRPLIKMNKVEGALIYPEFNLLVQPDATNNHWSCDHLALVGPTTDSTPAISHAVINSVNARHIVEFMDANSMITRRFNKRSECIIL